MMTNLEYFETWISFPDLVLKVYNSSISESEPEGIRVLGQVGIHRESVARLFYRTSDKLRVRKFP